MAVHHLRAAHQHLVRRTRPPDHPRPQRTYCHRCHHQHLADDARMVARFTPAPVGFRANYPGAQLVSVTGRVVTA
jgi:hypothetical protein